MNGDAVALGFALVALGVARATGVLSGGTSQVAVNDVLWPVILALGVVLLAFQLRGRSA